MFLALIVCLKKKIEFDYLNYYTTALLFENILFKNLFKKKTNCLKINIQKS